MLCSKCSTEPAIEGQRWCRGCRAAYMRVYRVTVRKQGARRSLRRGMERAQALIGRRFEELGHRQMNGYTAAEIVREMSFT